MRLHKLTQEYWNEAPENIEHRLSFIMHAVMLNTYANMKLKHSVFCWTLCRWFAVIYISSLARTPIEARNCFRSNQYARTSHSKYALAHFVDEFSHQWRKFNFNISIEVFQFSAPAYMYIEVQYSHWAHAGSVYTSTHIILTQIFSDLGATWIESTRWYSKLI